MSCHLYYATVTCLSIKNFKSCAEMRHENYEPWIFTQQITALCFLLCHLQLVTLSPCLFPFQSNSFASPYSLPSQSISFLIPSRFSDMKPSINMLKAPTYINHSTMIQFLEYFQSEEFVTALPIFHEMPNLSFRFSATLPSGLPGDWFN